MSDQTHHRSRSSFPLSRRLALRTLIAAPLVGLAISTRVSGLINRALGAAPAPNGTPTAYRSTCVGSPAATDESEQDGTPMPLVTITMTTQLRFEPEVVTLHVGDSVIWKNDSILPHTVTGDPAQNPVATSHPEYVGLPSGAEPWGSALLQPGESFSYTFTVPGEYHYICVPHVLSGMRGKLVVSC